jgi:serine/threonine-protein kinase
MIRAVEVDAAGETVPAVAASGDSGGEPRTLLQARLSLYGKVLFLIDLGFWPGFYLIWSRDPTAGHAETLRHVLSPAHLALMLVDLSIWLIPRGRPRSLRWLQSFDVVANMLAGICFALLSFTHPHQVVVVYETLLAQMGFLAIRALVVPSTHRRTLLVGLVTCLPSAIALLGWPRPRPMIGSATAFFAFLNWSAVAIAFSTVASAVLYGLRRQVREAKRLGQYTLLEKLGQGGMGVVYRASHAMLRRPTAIKILSATGARDSLQRFEREVQMMSQLKHPNAVAIHDYGRTADGLLYYAMEYLEGLDLERLVELDGPQPPARVIHLLRQVCGALAEAHGAGLIHRDVKPANLFLCRERGEADFIKVLDFGLVKETASVTSATLEGGIGMLGTPLYMSPEAISNPSALDARSDLYSLGAVGYLLVTGEPVFRGRNAVEVCAQHLHTTPVAPHERLQRPVPADLEAVLLRCLSKRADDRYPGARELSKALGACADANRWDSDEARAWWAGREAKIKARRIAVDAAATPGKESVVVDTAVRPS